MGTKSIHDDVALAALEVLFRGLYTALTQDPALRKSLVMFLPYYIKYTSDGHRVKLIHPRDALSISFPLAKSAAHQFLDDNGDLMKKAAAQGRDLRSIAHKRVQAPKDGEQEIGGYIDPAHPGNVQYRVLITGAPTDAGVEYNVEHSCPHLYPVLGILRQADRKMIGMVSMDFEDRLCEKVAAVFNTFMEPYSKMRLWEDLRGETLSEYLLNAEMRGSWCEAGKSTHNGFATEAELVKACDEICAKLTPADWEKLEAVLKAAPNNALPAQHTLLKALQGCEQFVPALWICLGNGARACIAPENFTIRLSATGACGTETLRRVSLAAGEVHKAWDWSGCRFEAPWLLLQCNARDPFAQTATRWLTRDTSAGDGQTALSNLAGAISVAWPNHFAQFVELRLDDGNVIDNSPNAILSTFHIKTPVGVILGANKVNIAVRGQWRKA